MLHPTKENYVSRRGGCVVCLFCVNFFFLVLLWCKISSSTPVATQAKKERKNILGREKAVKVKNKVRNIFHFLWRFIDEYSQLPVISYDFIIIIDSKTMNFSSQKKHYYEWKKTTEHKSNIKTAVKWNFNSALIRKLFYKENFF